MTWIWIFTNKFINSCEQNRIWKFWIESFFLLWFSSVGPVLTSVGWMLQCHWKAAPGTLHGGLSTAVLIVTSLGQPMKTGGWASRRWGEFLGLGGGGRLSDTACEDTNRDTQINLHISMLPPHSCITKSWSLMVQNSPPKHFYMFNILPKTWINWRLRH